MKKYFSLISAILLLIITPVFMPANPALFAKGKTPAKKDSTIYLLIRADDIGMSHAVNMGFKKLLKTGMPVSASVMWACPWYQEAVKILKKHPNVSVGIHLTLNSEWNDYRWGPISGRSAVLSLVDSNGYFYHSTKEFYDNNPRMDQVKKELQAQIKRALHSGLKIDYVDYHMLTAYENPQVLKIIEQLAKKYHLGMARFFGENYRHSQYAAPVNAKTDSLVQEVKNIKPGINAIFVHVAVDNPELAAMKDASGGLSNMAANRQAVLNALTSKRFRDEIRKNHVKLITYRDLINKVGLQNMHK